MCRLMQVMPEVKAKEEERKKVLDEERIAKAKMLAVQFRFAICSCSSGAAFDFQAFSGGKENPQACRSGGVR